MTAFGRAHTLPRAAHSCIQTNVNQVYICEDIAWGGHCEHKLTKPGGADIDCTQLSGNASSIGPDPGFLCEFYT